MACAVVLVAVRIGKKKRRGTPDLVTAYLDRVGAVPLMTGAQERDLAIQIVEAEIHVWRLLLSVPARAESIVAFLDMGTRYPLLAKAATEARESESDRAVTYLTKVAGDIVTDLRWSDPDRVLLDRAVAQTAHDDTVIRAAVRKAARMRDQFVERNLRLVVTMASRYDNGAMLLEDLIQEGNLGLIHAVSRFDYRRGLRFSTYACWWIRHAIGRAIADKSREVRVPVHMLEAQQALEKVRHRLSGELGRPPTVAELGTAAKLAAEKVAEMGTHASRPTLSLDDLVPVPGTEGRQTGSMPFAEILIDRNDPGRALPDLMHRENLSAQLNTLMQYLSPLEVDVLVRRFGLGETEELTFREIGAEYGISRERVRTTQNTALAKLRQALEQLHGKDITG